MGASLRCSIINDDRAVTQARPETVNASLTIADTSLLN